MRVVYALMFLLLIGCHSGQNGTTSEISEKASTAVKTDNRPKLHEAKKGFVTKLIKAGEYYGPADPPPGDVFKLVKYESSVGPLAAYVTHDPGDGQKHPAIIWITGGDNNSIGDVWSPNPRTNDQSASAFRKAGIVMMFPSQRGGNDNPGAREGFLGEVDDILDATDYLASLHYVDSERIYLGGHSTGGTLAMLVGATSDRYSGVFSLGPVASVAQYGGSYVYCAPNDRKEMILRSPNKWLHCVKSPMYVIEGADGNWNGSIDTMALENRNPQIKFFRVPGYDHFNVIAPVVETLAKQIVEGEISLNQETFNSLK